MGKSYGFNNGHYRNTHRPTPSHTDPEKCFKYAHRLTLSHTDPEKCFKYAHQPTPTLKNALNMHTDPHRPSVALEIHTEPHRPRKML